MFHRSPASCVTKAPINPVAPVLNIRKTIHAVRRNGKPVRQKIRSLFFRHFRAVTAARLFPIRNTGRIEGAANDMISYTREVFYPAASDEDNAMFLQVMADSRNVSRTFHAVYKANPCNLRRAEFGFLGVIVLTARHTPLFWGDCFSIGEFDFET